MEERWQDWPAELHPSRAPVYSFNSLEIAAPADAIWRQLVRAERWPDFYGNAHDVRIESGPGPDLALGTVFRWRTFGVPVRTRVISCEPGRALAWRGDEFYGRGMHIWLLHPTERGCRVVTEEVQAGLVPSLGRLFLRRGLLKWHQRWLEGLAASVLGEAGARVA